MTDICDPKTACQGLRRVADLLDHTFQELEIRLKEGKI